MKKLPFLVGIALSFANVLAHGDADVEFTPGVNPFEYFSHGYHIYGIAIVVLWALILWGIYTLLIMVIGKHIK